MAGASAWRSRNGSMFCYIWPVWQISFVELGFDFDCKKLDLKYILSTLDHPIQNLST